MSDHKKKPSAQDEELSGLLEAAGLNPAEELGTVPVAPVGPKVSDVVAAPAQPTPAAAVSAPEPPAPTTAPPAPPAPQKPWYSSLVPDIGAIGHGAGQGATLGLNDEIAGGLMHLTRPSTREGIPATYAGQDAIDSIRQDQEQARERAPASYFAGRVAGAAPMAVASGGGSLPEQIEMNAGLMGAQMLGSSTGGLGDRVNQVGQFVAEHPGATAAAVAAPAVVKGLSEGVEAVGQNALDASNRLMTQTFMTPAARAALEARKGPGSLAKLGQEAREAGLYKPRNLLEYLLPTSARRVAENAAAVQEKAGRRIGELEENFGENAQGEVPVSGIAQGLRTKAADLDRNFDLKAPKDAAQMRALADRIQQAEKVPVTGTHVAPPPLPEWSKNPQPPAPAPRTPEQTTMSFEYPPFTPKSLEGQQQPLPFDKGQLPLPGTEGPSAATSSALEGSQRSFDFPPNPQGQLSFPPEMTMGAPKLPASPGFKPAGLPNVQTELPVSAQKELPFPYQPRGLEGAQAELGLPVPRKGPQYIETPLQGEASLERDAIPLADAFKNKRDIADRIDWARKPGAKPASYGAEAARKYVWGGLKDQIRNTLQQEAAAGRIDPAKLAEYDKSMKDFSVAATAYDPALKLAERQGQTGLNLNDLMFAAATGSGGVGAMGSSALRGMAPAVAQRAMRVGGRLAQGAGRAMQAVPLSPIAQAAAQNPTASKPQIEKAANLDLKSQLMDWFRSLANPK